MNALQLVALLGGLVILAAPMAPKALAWMKTPASPKGPTYRDAIAHLADVRLRLTLTEKLGDDQRAAIDVLTLALVDGSDQ